MHLRIKLAAAAAGLTALLDVSHPAPALADDYILGFSPPVSERMLDGILFEREEPLDLGACSTTLFIDGPIGCGENCEGAAVCIGVFEDLPAGLEFNDLVTLVEPGALDGTRSRMKDALRQ